MPKKWTHILIAALLFTFSYCRIADTKCVSSDAVNCSPWLNIPLINTLFPVLPILAVDVSGLAVSENLTVTENVSGTLFNYTGTGSSPIRISQSMQEGASYNLSVTKLPAGKSCVFADSTAGTLPATGITTLNLNCTAIQTTSTPVLHTLYVLNNTAQTLQAFSVYPDGSLVSLATYSVGNKSILLWNGKHIIVGGGTELMSLLRNPDGTLSPVVPAYTVTNGSVSSTGTPSVNPAGTAVYYKNNNDNFSEVQISTNGNFSGEVSHNGQSLTPKIYWAVPGPVHPTGNYLLTFHKSGQVQYFWPIPDPLTGVLGTQTLNTANISTPGFYPELGNCIYSSNGKYLYCADNGVNTSGSNLKQMSVTSTSLTPLTPFSVTVDGVQRQGPKAVLLHPGGNYIFVYGTQNLFSFNVDTVTTGLVGTQINSVAAPGSCPADFLLTNLAVHPDGTYLYSICPSTGSIGAYPVSSSGALGSPVMYTTSAATVVQYLLLVKGD